MAETRRLDHLPLVAQALKRLRVAEIVDGLVPPDPRSHVTTGECVEALVLAIHTGRRTLYRVNEHLDEYDLETLMGWNDEAGHVALRFNDERLGNALDALFWCEGGLPVVNSALSVEAIKVYELATKQIHMDLTSITTYGQYSTSKEPEDPESPHAVPHVTYGHSKARRPDLKQILVGLAVTADGGVPLAGRAVSGNRGEPLETRYLMERLAKILPSPEGTTLVGDCKLFSGETILLAAKYNFRYLTLVPHSVGIREEAFLAFQAAKAKLEELPLLLEREERPGEAETWRGLSFPLVYNYEHEDAQKKKVVTPIPLRVLVVESSALRRQKLSTLTRHKATEREALEKASKKLRQRKLSSREKALAAANHLLEQKKPRFHQVTIELVATNRPVVRRGRRGRRKKDEPRQYEWVYSTSLKIEDDSLAFARLLDRESCFVLTTDRPSTGTDALADAEMLRVYKDEHKVEGCFKTSKGPLEIAPVLLKTPERLAALTLVYVVALMVYALVQRETRSRLAAKEAQIPGNRGLTARPTTEVVYRLMRGVATLTTDEPGSLVRVVNMTTEQARLLDLLNNDLLRRPSLHVDTPTVPRRGQRGYRPPVRDVPETQRHRRSIS